MKNIYRNTTLVLLGITATLATIGLRPQPSKPIAKLPVAEKQFVAQAANPNSGT